MIWLVLLILPAGWLYMHRWYRKIWGRRLRWYAIPLAHGAVFWSKRLPQFEVDDEIQ